MTRSLIKHSNLSITENVETKHQLTRNTDKEVFLCQHVKDAETGGPGNSQSRHHGKSMARCAVRIAKAINMQRLNPGSG